MSSLIVEVTEIKEIKEHPNADALEIAIVKGWSVITKKGLYSVGDRAVYVPPDSLMPRSLAQELGIEQYLSWSSRYKVNGKGEDHPDDLGRVRCANLRGTTSYGTLIRADGRKIGEDVAEELGIQKWEPPVKVVPGDAEADHPLFHKYYDMENLRNFPEELSPGEEIVATEKTHGHNVRVAVIKIDPENGQEGDGVFQTMVGSHGLRRKLESPGIYGLPLQMFPDLPEKLQALAEREGAKGAILFGEVYGPGLQDLHYGLTAPAFRAFDLCVDGRYMSYDPFFNWCSENEIPMMPVLFRGPFSFEEMEELATGRTTMMDQPGKKDVLEGIVLRSAVEGPGALRPRKVLKLINPEYLTRKGGSEDH